MKNHDATDTQSHEHQSTTGPVERFVVDRTSGEMVLIAFVAAILLLACGVAIGGAIADAGF